MTEAFGVGVATCGTSYQSLIPCPSQRSFRTNPGEIVYWMVKLVKLNLVFHEWTLYNWTDSYE